jgi:hypothetical protein
MAGIEPPTSNEGIKAVVAGIRRSIGTSVTRKAPATAETVRVIIADIPEDLRGLQDRAILLLGFAGALRRSLDVSDLEESTEDILVRIKPLQDRPRRRWRFRLNPPLAASSRCSGQGVA